MPSTVRSVLLVSAAYTLGGSLGCGKDMPIVPILDGGGKIDWAARMPDQTVARTAEKRSMPAVAGSGTVDSFRLGLGWTQDTAHARSAIRVLIPVTGRPLMCRADLRGAYPCAGLRFSDHPLQGYLLGLRVSAVRAMRGSNSGSTSATGRSRLRLCRWLLQRCRVVRDRPKPRIRSLVR